MSSTAKIFAVLEAVVSCQAFGAAFSEVVKATGLPKASVHRLLKELHALGYLTYSEETKKYRGSLRLASLGAGVMANFELRDIVHAELLKLNHTTTHTCNMGIKNGDVGVFVDKIESQDYGIRLFSEVGKNFQLHCTGMGKVLLAHSDREDVERILAGPMPAMTDKTITNPEHMRHELEEVKQLGYAVDREEITRGIMCVAAPVFGSSGEIVCAISLAFPSYINTDRGIDPEIKAVTEAAARISGGVGGL